MPKPNICYILSMQKDTGKLEVDMQVQKRNFTENLSFFTSKFSVSEKFCFLALISVLCALCRAPAYTAVTTLKDLAQQNYSWRQTNITGILAVCGFALVVGRAGKDPRNICEFVSFILEQVLIPLTLCYEVFEI